MAALLPSSAGAASPLPGLTTVLVRGADGALWFTERREVEVASALARDRPAMSNLSSTFPRRGKVAMVASDAPVDGRIAVIVQNGSTTAVDRIRVSATSTSADGAADQGHGRRSLPATLAPGAIALGIVEISRPMTFLTVQFSLPGGSRRLGVTRPVDVGSRRFVRAVSSARR